MAKKMVTVRAILAIVLVVSILVGIIGCAPVSTTPDTPSNQEESSVQLNSGVTVDSNTDTDSLSRDEKEQVAEVLGGTDNASDLSDKELDDLVDDLIANLEPNREVVSDVYDENGAMTEPFDVVYPELIEDGTVTYDEETLLIKLRNNLNGTITEGMAAAGVAALEAIVPLEETTWYEAKLIDGTDAAECLAAIRELKEVVLAEYNYEIQTAQLDHYTEFDNDHNFGGNDHHDKQWYMHHCGIPDGMTEMTTDGGSSSVIVAVIDSGVDYDHEDLSQNIWVNEAEIPDNGIDDDGNGYIDDYYGVNIITGRGNGDDDNGHGTHVAGIIAAQDNNLGVVGIAYNVKVMPVKAAMASGTLNQSDIAKAVLYAYEMGAEVINMSFGGSACSIAVQDALAVAYTRCVLVASAGNDGLPNQKTDYYYPLPNYPAALTYVLGVMSVDQNGVESGFTNWDAVSYNGCEYELYAPGEAIMSTLPNNTYGTLSGTSMAAPVVSAIAAILRSEFADRDMYPTKFIYGQLCSTSGYTATCLNPRMHTIDGETHDMAQIVDLYSALTKLPNPEVHLQDYDFFDTTDIAKNNSADGVIDAGETIALGVTLRNRWGMSENTIVTIDTLSVAGIADPYVTILNPSVDYGSVGTYSTQNAGAIYTDELLTGWEHPFYIQIAKDCPNDYRIKLNVTITCSNALDTDGTAIYKSTDVIWLEVRNGVVLPSIIEEDMVLTPDNLYIIPNATVIEEGVTVRVEPGTHIQFWSSDPGDPYADNYIAYLLVKGNFLVEGTKEDPVYIYPSDLMDRYNIEIGATDSGFVSLIWSEVTNLLVGANNTGYGNKISYAEHCTFRYNYGSGISYRFMSNGVVRSGGIIGGSMASLTTVKDSVFYKIGFSNGYVYIYGNADRCIFVDCSLRLYSKSFFAKDCVFLGNDFWDQSDPDHGHSSFELTGFGTWDSSYFGVSYNAETGHTYVLYHFNSSGSGRPSSDALAEYLAAAYGAGYAVFETEEEYLSCGFSSNSWMAGIQIGENGNYLWSDGTPVGDFLLPLVMKDEAANHKNIFVSNGSLYQGACFYSLFEIPGQILVTDITFHEYEVMMDLETTYQLAPLSAPLPFGADQFLYESSDENVVTVDEKGLVTPVGIGTADITVYSVDRVVSNHVTFEVHEYVALEELAFTEDSILLATGDTVNMACTLTPVNTTRRNTIYTSSDENVVTVDAGGNLTAIGNGTATITAQCESLTAELVVTVYTKTTSIDITALAINVSMETESAALPSVSYTENATMNLVWESSDEKVLKIRDNAMFPQKEGYCVVTVTDTITGLSDSLTVCVTETAVSGVIDMQIDSYLGSFLMADGGLYTNEGMCLLENVKCYEHESGFLCIQNDNRIAAVSVSGAVTYYDFEELADKELIDISGSNYSSQFCAFVLTADGDVYAWGRANTYGILGLGTTEAVTVPTKLVFNEPVVQIETYDAAMAYFLTESGNLYVTGGGKLQATYPQLVARNVSYLYEDGTYFVTNGYMAYFSSTSTTATVTDVAYHNFDYAQYDSYYYGLGVRNGKVYSFNTTSESRLFPEIENAVRVQSCYTNNGTAYYIATSDGLVYAIGGNYSSMMSGTTSYSKLDNLTLLPILRFDDETLELVKTNLSEDQVLASDNLVLTLNKSLLSSSVLLYENGTLISDTEVIDGNILTVNCPLSFAEGVTYKVVISSQKTYGYALTYPEEEIIIEFTYQSSESEDNMQSGDAGDKEDTQDTVVIHESQLDETIERYHTAQNITDKLLALQEEIQLNPSFVGNVILNRISTDTDVTHWLRFQGSGTSGEKLPLGSNYWGTTNETAIGLQIIDYADFVTYGRIMYAPYLTEAPENTFPFVTSVTILNKEGEAVNVVGNETITVRITFNRDMDTTIALNVRFGSAYPYADYEISGEYVDARTWEGTYTLNTIIENGLQYWNISNGCSATEDLQLQPDTARFGFEIDTTAAQALLMQGYATETGIQLSWTQDDFDTLMGYNVYRSTSEDGLYVRLNSTVIPANTMSFFDDSVEPGVVYYYNFTVVKTDLTESDTSGKISIMSMDTMAPNIYHTPVSTSKTGSNLVISATVTDNLSIVYANVYYRVAGTEEWNKAVMNCLNSRYSAIITADYITVDGLEYYIEAFDGVSYTYKGTAEDPYTVTIYEAVDAASLGDVDGNGAVTAYDALLVLYARNDKYNLTAEQFYRADLNGDGELSAAEALRILQYVTGTVGSLTMN